mmetsp:Transcript_2850/g.8600  ORF Transcript_2850/g.8600 Transcript_2850/m.8600 type:complete len:226 (-) Transcript_2850:123-800(-)
MKTARSAATTNLLKTLISRSVSETGTVDQQVSLQLLDGTVHPVAPQPPAQRRDPVPQVTQKDVDLDDGRLELVRQEVLRVNIVLRSLRAVPLLHLRERQQFKGREVRRPGRNLVSGGVILPHFLQGHAVLLEPEALGQNVLILSARLVRPAAGALGRLAEVGKPETSRASGRDALVRVPVYVLRHASHIVTVLQQPQGRGQSNNTGPHHNGSFIALTGRSLAHYD